MATNNCKHTQMNGGAAYIVLCPYAQVRDVMCSLIEQLMSLWFVLASLPTPLGPHSQQCVYEFNVCPPALSLSDPTFYIHHHLPAEGWNDVAQQKLKVKAMFALVWVAVPHALAPRPPLGARPPRHLGSKPSPHTHFRSRIVNYLWTLLIWQWIN